MEVTENPRRHLEPVTSFLGYRGQLDHSTADSTYVKNSIEMKSADSFIERPNPWRRIIPDVESETVSDITGVGIIFESNNSQRQIEDRYDGRGFFNSFEWAC